MDVTNGKPILSDIPPKVSTQPAHESTSKPVYREGDTVDGEIVDIQADKVTLKTKEGEWITGRVKQPFEAKIGQEIRMTVSWNKHSEMVLQTKPLPRTVLQNEVLVDTLKLLGFKPTQNHLDMALQLLQNKFPLNKENMQKLNQALKLMGSGNEDKAIFMLKNEIPIQEKNTSAILRLVNENAKLGDGLEKLMKSIQVLPESELKQNLTKIIADPAMLTSETNPADSSKAATSFVADKTIIPNEMPEAIKTKLLEVFQKAAQEGGLTEQKVVTLLKEAFGDRTVNQAELREFAKEAIRFLNEADKQVLEKAIQTLPQEKAAVGSKWIARFNPERTGLTNLEQYLTELKTNLNLLKNEMAKTASTPENNQIRNELRNVTNQMEFAEQVKDTTYLQIPLQMENQNTTAELYVFRDKTKTSKKTGTASALIALDTANLGRFEAYIQKNDKSIDCQFRVENETIETLVKQNIQSLQHLLQEQDFVLIQYTFKQLTEPFTILDKPEEIQKEISELGRLIVDIRA